MIFYKQHDSMDCGPTCLRMVAKWYKRTVSQQELRDKSQIGKEGVNLLGISEAAEAIGFRTKAVKLEMHVLMHDAILPAILHWNQNHYVVLYKINKGIFFIADPAKGLMRYSAQEFRKFWINSKAAGREEGIALLLEPSPQFYAHEDPANAREPIEKNKMGFKNIFQYLLPYKKLVGQLFIGVGVASLLQLFLPFLMQSIVDTGIGTSNMPFIYIILLAQVALFSGRLAVEFIRGWVLLHISTRINISILTDFLIKLMKLPLSFFDSKHTGDILQRINDHSRIESFLTGSSINTFFSLLNLAVFSVVLALFNLSIFSVFIVASIVYTIWVVLFLRKRKELDYKRFDVGAREQSAAIQLVQGMQEIKLNGVEKPMRWAWEGLRARIFQLSVKSLSLNQWQQGGSFFINEGKNILITFLSAKAVINGDMSLGAMLAIQYIIGQLNSPIEQLVGFIQSWQNAKISIDRLNEIHSLEDEEPIHFPFHQVLPPAFAMKLSGGQAITTDVREDSVFTEFSKDLQPGKIVDNKLKGPLLQPETAVSLHFENVSFTYPGAGNEPVLKDINLCIPQGKTTAIVGISGSGKSTLLKLLLKFYAPQNGTILLDKIPLQHISHKLWRANCGVVMQESFIFSDTIARNIAVGAERVDMGRLYQALEVANIREFIESLPLGLNTRIGAEGNGISMGQKQRLLIARAVYRDPHFLFFDEATNSLDANNELVIINNLQSFFKGRTVIVVAHRLSTVKNADQIIVLNRGRITEVGTHTELVSLKGAYFTLVKNQLELGS